MSSLVTFSIEYTERPWTTNGERASNRWVRAKLVLQWRNAFHALTKYAKPPRLEWCEVTVEPYQHGGRLQDVAACNPAVKAAIDGIVDAGVIPDDSPEYLKSITFLAPKRGKNSLVLHVTGQPAKEGTL